jgi:hypothetical protein
MDFPGNAPEMLNFLVSNKSPQDMHPWTVQPGTPTLDIYQLNIYSFDYMS